MRYLLHGALLWSMALCFHNVAAQPMDGSNNSLDDIYGTRETKHNRLTVQGYLKGCTIEYTALIRDWTYSKGAPLLVTGHFGLYAGEENIIWTLKVVTNDVRDSSPPEFVSNKPFMAYLEDSQGASNIVDFDTSHDSDTAGGKLYIFKLHGGKTSTNKIFEAILSNRISVVFNRKENGADIRVPIDLSVIGADQNGVRMRGQKTVEDFSTCSMQLLDSLAQKVTK